MNSDELGAKGESHFEEICADASLICNKATRDRGGWDFIVEFPLGTDGRLDAREAPRSVLVQLKTVEQTSEDVKIRLTVAERLAKDPKPTFIYVFVVRPDLTYSESRLLHIAGDRLAKILKRLRVERAAKGRPRVNKQFIKFSIASMLSLAPTGAALRTAIEDACPDFRVYPTAKNRELNELGFEAGAYRSSATFKVASFEEMADGLLGLRPLSVTNFFTTETRFGIELPLDKMSQLSGELKFTPEPTTKCTLTFRDKSLVSPLTFRADLFVAPRVAPQSPISILIKHQNFIIKIQGQTFDISEDDTVTEVISRSIPDWLNVVRLRIHMLRGSTLTIKPDGKTALHIPISPNTKEDAEPYERMLELLSKAERLFSVAGHPAPATTLEHLFETEYEVRLISDLLSGKCNQAGLSFTIDDPKNEEFYSASRLLLVAHADVASTSVAVSLVADVELISRGDELRWRSRSLDLHSIEVVASSEEFDDFKKRVQAEVTAPIYIEAPLNPHKRLDNPAA